MSFFKKKEEKKEAEELPELPQLPDLPNLPELPNLPKQQKNQTPKSFPSFPNSQFGAELSQEAVKSAVAPKEKDISPIFQQKAPVIKEKRTIEIPEELSQSDAQEILHSSILESPLLPAPQPQRHQFPKTPKKTEPVYIRIDKFNTAVAHFQELQNKIYEIESLLKRIKEVKQKEDLELRDWEKELETMKSRIDSIDKNIFSRME